jgi:hypothetical protein
MFFIRSSNCWLFTDKQRETYTNVAWKNYFQKQTEKIEEEWKFHGAELGTIQHRYDAEAGPAS